MARIFCIPGIIFLLCAFVLSFLVSISLPFLPALDIVRSHFGNGGLVSGDGMSSVRFGIWSACAYATDGSKTCLASHHGYSIGIANSAKEGVIIGSSWTRGLAVHPVATAVTFVALVLSFSQHTTVTLISSLTAFLAALLTLIAFAIDIALFAYVKHKIHDIPDLNGSTLTGPGFWLTFVSLILLLLAGCTVCFGRRRDRMSGASSYPMSSTSKPGFLSRFRRRN